MPVAAEATTAPPSPEPTVDLAPTAAPTGATATPRKPAKSPGRTPATRRSTATKPAGSSAPPWCQLADLTFSLSLGTGGGTGIVGSILLTNRSSRRCALTGYLGLTWRDAGGAVIPVDITFRPDPQIAHTIAIDAGKRGIVGLGWQRYKTNPPIVPCTPLAKTLEVRLPPTVQNPHPENKPGKRIAWFGDGSGGMCGPKATMLPVNEMF